jgi:amino acid adenylation domain-containing protein
MTQTLPLTAAQTALVNAQQTLGPSTLYWTAQYLVLNEPLHEPIGMSGRSPSVLTAALSDLLEACDALQYQPILGSTTDSGAGSWMQQRSASSAVINTLDLRTAVAPEIAALECCNNLLAQPFTLGQSPLYQCQLLLLPQATWVYLQVHHLAFDGYSYALFWQALCTRLNRPESPLPDWDIKQIVQADQVLRQSPQHQKQVANMRTRLPPPEAWHAQSPLTGLSLPKHIAPRHLQLDTVKLAASSVGLSWPQWIATACAWALYQLGWTHDKPMGLVNMARRGPQARVPLMCMGVQPLMTPAAQTIETFIAGFITELKAWQSAPDVRWEELSPAGFSHHLGAYVNLLLFPQPLNLTGQSPRLAATTLAQGPVQQLNLNLSLEGCELRVAAAVPQSWDTFGTSLLLDYIAQVLIHPQAKPQFTTPNLVHAAKAPAPIDLLGSLWRQQATTPEAPAYRAQTGAIISYQQLYRQVVSLSHALRLTGVLPGMRIALWAEAGVESLIAFLAIAFCRASYLPLDPKTSPERLRTQLGTAQARYVLANATATTKLDEWLSDKPLDRADHTVEILNLSALLAGPQAPLSAPPAWEPAREAYVLFTSGSSGEPKGVCMSWGAYGQFLAAAQQAYQTPTGARWLQFAALSFDASLEEIGLCLSHGGCLYQRPDPCDFSVLNEFIQQHNINVLDLPTAYWHQWVASNPPAHVSLALTILGGEALCPVRLARWQQQAGRERLINSYGPTETCIVACAQELSAEQSPHLGRPLAGMGVLILDAQRQPVAPGQSGELFLFGAQLALGYLNPEQTRARFFTPAPALNLPGLLYATGDVARVSHDGELEFLGRNDDEIKLDGQRIDLQALTQAHLNQPQVAEAALWLDRSNAPPQVLAALVLEQGARLNTQTLRQQLAIQWPVAALPARYLMLEELPLNNRGKTDWAALAKRAATEQPSAAPDASLLQQLKQLWSECLGQPPSPDAHFWQAGGRSLSALVMAQGISSIIGSAVPAYWIYETPKFEQLCARIQRHISMAANQLPAAGGLNPHCLYDAGTDTDTDTASIYACAPIDGFVDVYRPLGLATGLSLWGLPAHGLLHTVNADNSSSDASSTDINPFDRWVAEQKQWLLTRPGPQILLGWSSGGSLALALAQALTQAGRPPQAVVVLDAYPPACWQHHPEPSRREALLNLIDVPEGFDPQALSDAALIAWLQRPQGDYASLSRAQINNLIDATLAQMRAFRSWHLQPYGGPVHHLAAALSTGPVPHSRALEGSALGLIHWHSLQATHLSLLEPAHVPVIAALLQSLAPLPKTHLHEEGVSCVS